MIIHVIFWVVIFLFGLMWFFIGAKQNNKTVMRCAVVAAILAPFGLLAALMNGSHAQLISTSQLAAVTQSIKTDAISYIISCLIGSAALAVGCLMVFRSQLPSKRQLGFALIVIGTMIMFGRFFFLLMK
jgi:hypothetical protein